MLASLTYEIGFRLGAFLGVLIVMAIWEFSAPRRPLTGNKPQRWLHNFGLAILNTLVLRLLVPVAATGVAMFAQSHHWGLFNNFSISAWLAIMLSVIVLDFAVYLQHVLFHAVPILWRLHMVHHTDLDLDVSTALRFHTIEIVLSFGIKCVVILGLGASPVAVLLFEVLLNGMAMFNHSNVRIPFTLDRWLRKVIVTPDMHRVHHSVIEQETNSNFGFNLSWWDFLLKTYRAQPIDGHEKMKIGLSQFRDERGKRSCDS